MRDGPFLASRFGSTSSYHTCIEYFVSSRVNLIMDSALHSVLCQLCPLGTAAHILESIRGKGPCLVRTNSLFTDCLVFPLD